MSRRNKQSAGTISLFPFLAVLVCAMGALILLLLVTTRRIRQQTVAQQSIVTADEEEPPVLEPAVPPTPVTAPDAQPAPPDPAAAVPILPLLAEDPPEPPKPRGPDPTELLQAKLASLESRREELESLLTTKHAQLKQIEDLATSATAVLANIRAESDSLSAEQERMNQLYLRLLDQHQQTEQRVEDLKQQIAQARADLAEADSKFAVVPYDGTSGTTRRPIIIECTEDRLTFASEGVTLTARDLDGFTERFNPVLYATQALIRFWERKDRMSPDDELGEPYVLLVVRPGGTTTYYVARELLAGLQQPFGYELVTDDQEFAWPKANLEASAICRMLVDKMLAERDELYDVALRQGAELPRHSDEQGRFRLDEVDRLKNPQRQVTINGQHFSRDASRLGTGARLDRHADSFNGGSTRPTDGSTDDSMNSPPGSRPNRREPGQIGAGQSQANQFGEDASRTGIHTQQQTAVTRADRMPQWLREGTTRLTSPTASHPSPQESPPTDVLKGRESANAAPDQWSRLNERLRSEQSTDDRAEQRTSASSSLQRSRESDEDRRPRSPIDINRPQWGDRTPGGTIGFEHEVRVEVSETQITVGCGFHNRSDTGNGRG